MKSALLLTAALLIASAQSASAFRLFPWQEDAKHNHTGPGHHHGPPRGPFSPKYEVLNKTFAFEERLYNSSTWASVNTSGWSWELALPPAVKKLLGYTHGQNEKDKHFPPGVPLLSRFVAKKDDDGDFSNCEKEFEVFVYLPKKPGCNGTFPAPIDKSILVKTYPESKLYASSFPGYAFSWSFKAEAFKLAKALYRANVSIHEGVFVAAVYDPPFKVFHRRNEVWFAPLPSSASDSSLFGSMQSITSQALTAMQSAAQQAMHSS